MSVIVIKKGYLRDMRNGAWVSRICQKLFVLGTSLTPWTAGGDAGAPSGGGCPLAALASRAHLTRLSLTADVE